MKTLVVTEHTMLPLAFRCIDAQQSFVTKLRRRELTEAARLGSRLQEVRRILNSDHEKKRNATAKSHRADRRISPTRRRYNTPVNRGCRASDGRA